MRQIDYLFWGIIAALLLVLVWGVTLPVQEPYTELYFDTIAALPNESVDEVTFTYSVHNAEGIDIPYRVRYAVDYLDEEGDALRQGARENGILNVSAGATVHPEKTIGLVPPFRRARISIELPGKDQSIHFWVRYAGNRVIYERYGEADLECLLTTPAPRFSLLTVTAHATYGDGWPVLTILHNGRSIGVSDIISQQPANYTFAVIPQQDNVFELIYQDDYYNITQIGAQVSYRNITFIATSQERDELIAQGIPLIRENTFEHETEGTLWNITIRDEVIEEETVGTDRNLYIDAVFAGSVQVPNGRFILERGLPAEWFDCRSAQRGAGDLTSPGALRLRVALR